MGNPSFFKSIRDASEDKDGGRVQVYLVVFKVISACLLLNVFTTIVIDAYNVAKDQKKGDKALSQMHRSLWETVDSVVEPMVNGAHALSMAATGRPQDFPKILDPTGP